MQSCLDLLGKDSVMGSNFVLIGEQWYCTAVNHTKETVKVIKINKSVLYRLRISFKQVDDAIEKQWEHYNSVGVS